MIGIFTLSVAVCLAPKRIHTAPPPRGPVPRAPSDHAADTNLLIFDRLAGCTA